MKHFILFFIFCALSLTTNAQTAPVDSLAKQSTSVDSVETKKSTTFVNNAQKKLNAAKTKVSDTGKKAFNAAKHAVERRKFPTKKFHSLGIKSAVGDSIFVIDEMRLTSKKLARKKTYQLVGTPYELMSYWKRNQFYIEILLQGETQWAGILPDDSFESAYAITAECLGDEGELPISLLTFFLQQEQ